MGSEYIANGKTGEVEARIIEVIRRNPRIVPELLNHDTYGVISSFLQRELGAENINYLSESEFFRFIETLDNNEDDELRDSVIDAFVRSYIDGSIDEGDFSYVKTVQDYENAILESVDGGKKLFINISYDYLEVETNDPAAWSEIINSLEKYNITKDSVSEDDNLVELGFDREFKIDHGNMKISILGYNIGEKLPTGLPEDLVKSYCERFDLVISDYLGE